MAAVMCLQAAIKAGVIVCLATGKARPAALNALTPVGLAGRHTLPPPYISHSTSLFA